MKQELIDSIKREYKDITKMIETNFIEEQQEFTTPGRKEEIKRIREKHSHWVASEDVDINDYVLDEAINSTIKNKDIGNTNKVLMYISELQYETYSKLFKDEIEIEENDPSTVYLLYMDIEDNTKYFVKKEEQKTFEETHNVVVTYKNPNCNLGWNHDRNIQGLNDIRNEFIKESFYNDQEEVAAQLIKKYPNR